MALSARTSLVLDAIRLALSTLATVPASIETEALRERGEACEHIAKRWEHVPPTPEKRRTKYHWREEDRARRARRAQSDPMTHLAAGG